MRRRILYFLTFMFLSSQTGIYAQSVNVSALLDKRSVQVDEEIHLTLRITGSQQNIQSPRLPNFNGFETYYTGRASHITFVNNVSTTKVEFSYVLIPKTAGRFTLDPIEVVVGGSAFRTEPISIEVLGNQGQLSRTAPSSQPQSQPQAQSQASFVSPPVQEPPPSFQPDDDNIFIQAWVDKNSVYTNEQLVLTYSLYTRYDTRYEGFSEEPELSGFWIEEFPMEQEIRRETVRVNGKRYIKADIRKVALFPTAASEYTIRPGTIKVSVRQEPQGQSIFDEFFDDSFFSGSGFFSRRESRLLMPPLLKLQVKPLPENGKPADFSGAVGNFRMMAVIDKPSVKQNEPVTMTLTVEGEGNIETMKQPAIPEVAGFKIYESDSSAQLFKTGNVVGGRKVFEIVFIPLTSGNLTIPKLALSFFNPVQNAYQSLATPQFPLQVTPSDKPFEIPKALSQQQIFKKDIEVESEDIRFIDEKLPEEASRQIFLRAYYGLLGLDLLLTLCVLFGLWKEYTESVFSKDNALKRRRLARSLASVRMKKLSVLVRLSAKDGIGAYFEEIEKILTQFLSDKFDLSAYGTTRVDIESALENSLGVEDPLYRDIKEVYRLCDESRFGKQELPGEIKDRALKILKQTIARVDKMRR